MSRILVVDDDRVQRVVASQALTRAGHAVLEAADGAEALEVARTLLPDLIVCDVLMPGINGFQFVTALRAEEGIAGIPVIMLSSMAERAHMRVGMNSGADDYLAKPFSFEELTEAVNALLAKRRTLQEGLISSMNTSFVTALEEQREALAAQYEERMVRQISARWDGDAEGDRELKYDHAVLIKAQIVGSLLQQAKSGNEVSSLVRQAYDSARDALHLFNAAHVLPAGNDLVAVFVDDPDSIRVRASVRAARAALNLLQKLSTLRAAGAGNGPGADAASTAAGDPPMASIALHCGPVTVLRITDPLHGGPASTLATGAAMQELDAIGDFARASRWGIAASPVFVGAMAGQVVTGRSAQVMSTGGAVPIDVLEVLSLR
ncbi:MAG: response regulator [Ramlibacter sp.]